MPEANGSSTSRTSVRCRLRTSWAKRSRPGAGERHRLEQLGVAVAWDDLGRDVLGAQPEALHHRRLDRGRDRGVGADRARELADRGLLEGTAQALEVAVGLEGKAGEPQPEGRRLGVDAMRAPDAERVGVLARLRDQRVAIGSRAVTEDRPGLDQLQAERGVEDVGGGQPVVDPATVLADRSRDDVDEGGDVVVGLALALLDRLDRERCPLARLRGGLGRDAALVGPGLGGGELDLEPALHPALVAPDGADLLACVSRDQAWMIRTASRPAFLAPSIATQPTGTPGGICTAESSASSPPRLLPRIGTPITGRSVCAAATPGQRGRHPGAGDDHPQAAHPRRVAVLAHLLGVAVGAHHPHLVANARLLKRLRRRAASSACRSSSP